MKRLSLFAIIRASLLVGAGCVNVNSFAPRSESISDIQNSTSTSEGSPMRQDGAFAWKILQKGIERGEQSTMSDGWSKRLVMYRFDPSVVTFRLVNAERAKSIRAWRDDFPQALYIMNGVYFNEDATPTGSLRIDGIEYSTSKFDADKSGVFEFDGAPSILDTTNAPILIDAASSSAQSYPFLIKTGALSIETDSGQLARRSFIGTDADGFVSLGAYPDAEISLYYLGEALKG